MSSDLDLLAGFESELAGLAHPAAAVPPDAPSFNLDDFDRYLLFTSGGKDSAACLLHMLELGVPRSKIELHHHRTDGYEGSSLMDWPCTDSFVKAMARAFDLPLFFSWKQFGIEGELLRENCGTAPIVFTRGDGTLVTMGGERSKPNTRRKFPQMSANLNVRWCSGVSKIDVASRMLINDPRFTEGKTLVITGERAEESSNRARYAVFEPDRADNRHGRKPRWIHHWRPVHEWTEKQVWAIMKKYQLAAHPAYFVGLSRASCRHCIFLGSNAWATMREIDPDGFARIAAYEVEFGVTIHRTRSVVEQADRGTSYAPDPFWAKVAMSKEYTLPIFMDPWILPKGALAENCGGPT
jgi:3'-phosphoadenosine 5'-phosphosulfate sulfotransferase (PAPS reductase)/FAD synthetase